ncbi:MAG: rod shape-determining protein MreC [Lachnospiraceae bacterium]|nr:rod shape-determining protein MreC [Lachnospiraceae bacterium]MBR6274802.1 rod shape-determining protein MreC [Lachnospiraceae bacterium]
MKSRFRYKLEPRYILLFATVILIALILLSYKFDYLFVPVRSKVASFMKPMEKGISVIGNGFEDLKEDMKTKEELRKQNENLQAEYDELKKKYDELLPDSYELENLRALFKLSQNYSSYETVGATVIASDTTGFNRTFTIDKGSKDGIKEDMNVIAGNGLVGIIYQVNDNYSLVRSIIDNNSNVSATILKSSDSCIVSGSLKLFDQGYIQIREIPINSTAANNYQVITSNQSSKFLPDILIGYVSNITVSSDGLSKEGYLTPVVDFRRLDKVLVITTMKESVTR